MKLLLLWFITATCAQNFEGSGVETFVDEYWLQRLIEKVEVPRYLMEKAYRLAENANTDVDDAELNTLDSMVPDFARKVFIDKVLNVNDTGENTLEKATDDFLAVLFYAFRSFGCDQDNIWPSVYNVTRDNLECIAFTLLQKVYSKSEFTRKYFARAIHFGITSNAPISHRISEMSVYQFLLPNNDRVWFNDLKIQLKNSLWNEQELSKMATYEDHSFLCGSVAFTDEIQAKIDYYYAHFL
ncbi:unnamed protein product [Caenorhabditis sp. 36 PRJEB53466]|nr:unnamed protein product [Caenorhabditis sp. 36 PRJEB53466]